MLVSNAGVAYAGKFVDQPPAMTEDHLNVNVLAHTKLVQVLLLESKAQYLLFGALLSTSGHFFQLLSASATAYSTICLNLPFYFTLLRLILTLWTILFNLTPSSASRMDVERKPSPYKQRHSDSGWRSDSDGEGEDGGASESGSLKGRRLRRRLADLSVGSEEELRNGKGTQAGGEAGGGAGGGEGDCLSAWSISGFGNFTAQVLRS